MAEEGDSGEKTEKPTGRRLGQARSEGMVARSVELTQLLSMVTAVLILQRIGPALWQKLTVIFRWGFSSELGTKSWGVGELKLHFFTIVYFILPDVLILMGVVAVVGVVATLLQTNFLWSSKLLRPNFGMLNPVNGLKRIISVQNLMNVIKQLAKLAIIGPIAYFGLMKIFPEFFSLMDLPLTHLLPYAANCAEKIFWSIAKLLLFVSILDYCYQRYRVDKQLKMSRFEVEDEKKSTDGDEKTRMKIRQKALQKARQRMLQAVKTADVIVTNPTHYAVALNYTDAPGSAPIVVAKGMDHLAARIRQIGTAHGVPIIERKLLARTLYANVEVGYEIPYELYAAVAELLAYVFRLKGKNPLKDKKKKLAEARA